MADINRIIDAIDEFLERNHQKTTTPVEINPILELKGLLNDSSSRPGLPIRKILRNGQIPHAYQIGVNWQIPHSEKTSKESRPAIFTNTENEIKKLPNAASLDNYKLKPIGDLILEIIENKYKQKVSCFYEYKPDWLISFPTKLQVEKYNEINDIYFKLVDNKFNLIEQLSKLTTQKLRQRQSFDIWIGEPYNFAVEFDEKQHFNQFRKKTLDYYNNIDTKFPIQLYQKLNNGVEIRPGNSGFTRLKSFDPLFPEILDGEKQDNRIRQRAFRDYLKDLLPIENGFNATLRIPYHVTNKNIKDFTFIEIENVRKYILENRLI